MPIFCTTRWQTPRWSKQAVFLFVGSRRSPSDWAAPLVGSIGRGAWLQGTLDGLMPMAQAVYAVPRQDESLPR